MSTTEAPNPKKTREDVEALKKNWLADPCWDIEETEGFEEFYAELYAFRLANEREWETPKITAIMTSRGNFYRVTDGDAGIPAVEIKFQVADHALGLSAGYAVKRPNGEIWEVFDVVEVHYEAKK